MAISNKSISLPNINSNQDNFRIVPRAWLDSAALPKFDAATRQVGSFYGATPGRLVWSVNPVTGDGRVGIQWTTADGTRIQKPSQKGTKSGVDLTLDEPLKLEVDLPRLTQFLELGSYVSENNAGDIDSKLYNQVVFLQAKQIIYKNLSVNRDETGELSAVLNYGHSKAADKVSVDYERKKLVLDFSQTFEGYYDNVTRDQFEFKGLLNSGFLHAGSYMGPDAGGINGVDYTIPYDYDEVFTQLDADGTYGDPTDKVRQNLQPDGIGFVYQSKDYSTTVQSSFIAADPNQTLYSRPADEIWFLLKSPNTGVNSVEESQSSTSNGILQPSQSELITVRDNRTIRLDLTSDNSAESQMSKIAGRGDDNLMFTRVSVDSAGNLIPTTARARTVLQSVGQFDIELEPLQSDFGVRPLVNKVGGDWDYEIILEGLTDSDPTQVAQTIATGPYALGQIPVWLSSKVGVSRRVDGNTSSEWIQTPSGQWNIQVRLVAEDGTSIPVSQVTAAQLIRDPYLRDADGTARTDDQGELILAPQPTTRLALNVPDGLTLNQGRYHVVVEDATFSQSEVNDYLATNEWLVWRPNFSSMQEAFTTLMSGYLQLFSNQLQLSSSVVEWYNGQIQALNDVLSIVNSWGLKSATEHREYLITEIFGDRASSTAPTTTDYGKSVRAQVDYVAHTLAMFDMNLFDYFGLPIISDTSNTEKQTWKYPSNSNSGDDNKDSDAFNNQTYVWGGWPGPGGAGSSGDGDGSGQTQYNSFITAVKDKISQLTTASQQESNTFSNLTSSYTTGVGTLTQLLEKLQQSSQAIASRI